MALLGEIVKTTQALRYHAKSSEIAGKNLSHVNDEEYARQRVLSRDGSMYREVGNLGTTALEMGGLDHARSALLDRRVVSEVGETASLEARKEILDLLQSVLGERVVREGVNVGLDDQLDSDLAPGSLTRALNDFFNAFQELSASPDEATVRQELFHKAHTLGKRFNEAGEKFDMIEGDLTETVKDAVVQVNAILEKLHEVNKQIRRFELQDKGKAATYRDRRQHLLESLAQYMHVKVEEDIDPTTGQASGLLNLFLTGAKGETIKLLDPNGPKLITTDWGQEFSVVAPADANGTAAKVRAKIGADGKLGQVEILDGGSRYSDKNGPIIVALAPPARKEVDEAETVQTPVVAGQAQQVQGEAEAVLQAGQPVDKGPVLSANTSTEAIPNTEAGGVAGAEPVEGQEGGAVATTSTAETAPDVPAPFSTEKGEVFHFDGSYYQALEPTAKGDSLADESKFMKLSSIPNGNVREFLWRYSDLESYAKGEQFYHEGKLYQANGQFSPVVEEVGKADAQSVMSTSQVYAAGDVMLYNGVYYQAYETVQRLQSLPNSNTAGEKTPEGFLVLGASLPSLGMENPELLSLAPDANQTVAKGQYFIKKSIDSVDVIKGGAGYQVGDLLDFAGGSTTSVQGTVSSVDATGGITAISISDYGSGYDLAPNVSVQSATGSGATLSATIVSDDKYYIALQDFDTNGDPSSVFDPAAKDPVSGALIHADKLMEVATYVDNSVKTIDRSQSSLSFKQGEIIYDPTGDAHYLVKRSFPELYGSQLDTVKRVQEFNPADPLWEFNLRQISPKLASTDKTSIVRRTNRGKFDPELGRANEVNLGLAEAILQKGEIVGFSMLGEGQGYPPPDSLFVEGIELELRSGAIHGYQRLRLEEMEVFRQHLNGLAKDFVSQINKIYNPEDAPGGYVFGFDGFLSRSVQNVNEIMEDSYGLTGVEGDGEFFLYRDEVEMIVPYPEKDTFQLTYAAPIFPEELAGQVPYVRNNPEKDAEILIELGDAAKVYGSAGRMKHVTVEMDLEYAGDDGLKGTADDGRMILHGYEKIPFRMQQGDKSFVFGDSFQFDSVPLDSWNVAKSMRVNKGFTVDSVKATLETTEGANEIALAIAELGNKEFTDRVSSMNTAIGNALSDVGDNLEHQKAVERLLLDERQAVSSVSIDEEVADLMRFQRSFQASAKVLSTLDRMLELVVMGLIR